MKKQILYLAYGSNMNVRDMKTRCPDASLLGTLFLKGYALEFRFYANIIPAPDKQVPAVLWAITEKEEAVLDEYEEVREGVYIKEKQIVELNGRKEALVYTMNPVFSLVRPPEHAYYQTIEEASHEHGFPMSILLSAREQAKEK